MSTHAHHKFLWGVLRVVSWSRDAHQGGLWRDREQWLCWKAFTGSHPPRFKPNRHTTFRRSGPQRMHVEMGGWQTKWSCFLKIQLVKKQAACALTNRPQSIFCNYLAGFWNNLFLQSSSWLLVSSWLAKTKQQQQKKKRCVCGGGARLMAADSRLNMYPWPRI